jgi:hypothetical protein
MGYYVLGDQGQKYGPADVATLNQWVAEGRVLATSMLEDETSGTRMAASAVRGLQFAAPNPVLGNQGTQYQQPQQTQQPYQQPQQPYQQPQQPYQQPQQPQQYSNYQRPQQYYGGVEPGDAQFKRAITLSIVSMVFSIVFSIAGIASGIAALVNAIQAKSSGHSKGTTGVIVAASALVFYVIVHIVKLGMFMSR